MPTNLVDEFDSLQRRQEAQGRAVGARSDPEAYATAERYAGKLGLPVETVARNIGAVKPQVIEQDAGEAAARAPVLASWLADTDNSRVGIDQAPQLADIEGSIKGFLSLPTQQRLITRGLDDGPVLRAPQAPKPTFGNIVKGLAASARGGLRQAGLGGMMAVGDAAGAVLGPISWSDVYGTKHVVDLTDQTEQKRQFAAEAFRMELKRPAIEGPGRYAYGGVESLLQTAPAIAASIALRSPTPALALGGAQSGAQQYGTVRERGGTAGEAALSGGATGAVEVLTEKIPLGFIVDKFGKTEFKRFISGMLLREVPSEQIATLAQDAIDTAIANPDATWQEYWASRPEAAAQTLASTIIQAGAIGAPALLANSREGVAIERDTQRAAAAPAVADQVRRLIDKVRASPMPERSPERFAALMDAMASDQEVTLPADRVREYLQTLPPEEQQAFIDATELGEQLDVAIGEGADVVMPAGRYLSQIAPTPAHDALADFVAWGDNMSLADAKSFDETYSELIASQAEEAGDVLATAQREAEPARLVFEDVQRQAREAGFTADASRQYAATWAARYEARAARNPDSYADAWAAYQASNVQIRADLPERVGEAARLGRVDVLIDTLRRGRQPAATGQGPSLLSFVSSQGGVVDLGGELSAMDLDRWHIGKPGKRKLVKAASEDTEANLNASLERMAERAVDAGYLPEGAGEADLLAAMQAETRGKPVFATPADQRGEDFADAVSQLDELLGRLGIDVSTATNEEIKTALEAYQADDGEGEIYEQAKPKTEEFRSWFEGSKVRHPVYHATTSDFEAFDVTKSDLGAHFGNEDQANKITKSGRLARPGANAAPNIIPVWLSIKNPLRLKDEGSFHADGIAVQLERKGILPKGDGKKIRAEIDGNWRLREKYDPLVKAAIQAAGYDGVVYKNEHEGEGDSYIAFAPSQIKSVNNRGTFDPADPRILNQEARGNITLSDAGAVIRMFQERNLSTLLHEGGHLWLAELAYDAARDNAPDQVKTDMATVMEWLGGGEPANLSVEQHEQFARGVEAYMMEGKAPSPALRDVFRNFALWLKRIYRQLSALDVTLSDEIRDVFSRLIATDEEIAATRQSQALNRLFADAKSAGMTADEYARYTNNDKAENDAVTDRMLKKIMDPLRRARTAEWKAERETLREDAEAEVDAQPDIAVMRIMTEGKLQFSRQALVDMYGSDAVLDRLPKRVPPIYSDKGALLPDLAAQGVGASSGEALVDALMNQEAERQRMRAAGDKRSVRDARVDGLMDDEMRSRYGDALTDGSIEAEALDALHERKTADRLAKEGAQLAKLAGAQTAPWSRAAFEAFAKDRIGSMRAVKIRPAAFIKAERSAGLAAQRALAKGDFSSALEAKFTQTLNFHLYRAAVDAEAAANKSLALFETVVTGKDADVAKSRNLDIVNTARAVLAAYGFTGRRGSPDAYLSSIAEYDATTSATLQPYVDAAVVAAAEIAQRSNSTPPIDLATVDEFRDLDAVIRQLWTMSRADKVADIEGRKVRIDTIASELREELFVRHGEPPAPIGGVQAVTTEEKRKAGYQGALSSLKKVEEWAARQGPAFTRYIWRPVKTAADAYRADKNLHLAKLHEALQTIEADFAKPFKIEAPELGYVFGAEKNAGLAELIGALRHIGNDSNKRKLILGRGWGSEREDGSLDTSRWDAFLARMISEGKLEKRHFDYVQAEWDLHEEIKPQAQKAHRAMYGRYFEEVTANAFTTPWGEYRGGYVAAKVDAQIDPRAATLDDKDLLNGGRSGAFMFPGPANGFTKSRVEYNRPLDLNLRLAIRQMDDVLKFSHMGPAVRDVNRILTQREFSAALNAYDPTAWQDMLLPWLERTVSQRLTTPSRGKAGQLLDNITGTIARNTGMTIMFGSVINTAQQVTGLSVASLRTGKRNLGRALVDYIANPAAMTRMVTEASVMMADRNRSQMIALTDSANEIVLNPNLYEKAVSWTSRHAFFLQHAFQNVLDPIIWTAARNRAIELKEENPEAYADAVVASTQGSRNAEDVSRFSSGPAWASPFKLFSGYFVDQANLLATEWVKAGSVGRRAEVYALGFLVPSVLAQLIGDLLRGGWDDEEGDGYLDEFMDSFVWSQVRYALAMVPYAGQAANLVINRFDSKPYNDRLSLSPAATLAESAAAVPWDLKRLAEGEGNAGRTVKDVLTAVSLITGLPPLSRQVGYVTDVASGRVEPTGPVDATRGFITGTASPASRE